MKYIYAILIIFIFYGCSGQQISDNITKAQIGMSGNKPPAFFRIENVYTMDNYVVETKDFIFKLPFAKEKDYTEMGGWFGGSHRDGKTIVIELFPRKIGISYHIEVFTSGNVLEYGDREREIERGQRSVKQRTLKDGEVVNIDIHTEYYGKEKYPCNIAQSFHSKYGKKKISYECYKFNSNKTKAKSVMLTLTYHKVPTLPEKYKKLSKEYTYEDLQKRAKRTLDSLYIKADWDE